MHYFIIAAGKNHAQLFEVSGSAARPVAVEGMPTSMADAWKGMERESGDHNQRNANDVTEQEENEYMHKLAKSVHGAVRGPLVFAGVSEAYGMFKKYDASGFLLDEYVQGSTEHASIEDLVAKAEPIVRAEMLRKNEAVLEQFGALQGTGRTSVDAAEIDAKAKAGKVETLILPDGSEGKHASLAAEVSAHRGSTVLAEASHMPQGSSIAAILRL